LKGGMRRNAANAVLSVCRAKFAHTCRGTGAASRARRAARIIAPPAGTRVWLACGRTDMRKRIDGLAMLAQQVLNENPFDGALSAERGSR